jgi:hypothetical protein
MSNDSFLDALPEIRRRIYEEIKDMTVDERVAYINQCSENAAKKYGFEVVYLANGKRDEARIPTNTEAPENAKI